MALFYKLIRPLTYSRLRCWRRDGAIPRKTTFFPSPLQHMIDRRYFAVELYPAKAESVTQTLLDYIKVKNEISANDECGTLSNVFDIDSAIKQTRDLVIYSVEPSPKEVIRLFTLYSTSSAKAFLAQHFSPKSGTKVLEARIVSSIPCMSNLQLQQFSSLLAHFLSVKTKFIRFLRRVVLEECFTRLESARSVSEAFTYVITAMELRGHLVRSYDLDGRFAEICEKYVETASPAQLAHLLYLIGMLKNHSGRHSDLALFTCKTLQSHFEGVSFTDAGLALMGLFKMKLSDVPLSHKAAAKIMERISTKETSVHLDPLDSASLVSTVKYLRLTSYDSEELLRSLKLFLQKLDDASFSPPFVCHSLALYANCNVYDREIYSLMETKFLSFLQCPETPLRIKDVSRMMWCLAHAQHSCDETFLKLIVQNLEKVCETAELAFYPLNVVDATLSLAMLDVFPQKLYSALLRPAILDLVRAKHRSRHLSHLLILSQVQGLAHPSSASPPLPPVPEEELPRRTIHDECVHRPSVRQIAKAVDWLQKNCGRPVFELRFLVPHINHCSVVLTDPGSPDDYLPSPIGKRVRENLAGLGGRRIVIDVNDSNTCLAGEEPRPPRPVGLEMLKRRLLRQRGWTVKTLSHADVHRCGDDDMALAALLLQTALHDDQ